MRLYSYFRSSSAYRVRIAMNLKALPYSIEAVHLLKDGGKQFTKQHADRNPMQQVPVLEVDGRFLSQSMAICLYLESEFPQKPLLANDAWTRAQQLAFCEIINSGIQPLQNLSLLNKLDSKFQIGAEGKKEWMSENVTRGFDALENILQTSAGDHCFGDEISLADCFLVPQVFSAKRFGVDMNRFPLISAIDQNCLKLEAIQKAHPEQQADFEA